MKNLKEDHIKKEKNIMKMSKITNYLLLGILATSFAGCNKNHNSSSNNNGGSSHNYTFADVNQINDDLERDENGEFTTDYLENIQINMWSVIGDPDKTTLLDLVKKFNQEYAGSIEIVVTSVGHYDYYNALDNTRANEIKNFPDVCFMHNEKNLEYAVKGYFYPVDEIIDKVGIDLNFDNVYDNIERTTLFDNKHFGIPVDAHGYLTQLRQDIIKKNNLGFDNNTRYIPKNAQEYNALIEGLGSLAKSGELWTRNINANADHSWYQLKTGNSKLPSSVTSNDFFPIFDLYQENDALTALYTNGGSLLGEDGKVSFHKNEGFVKYVTNQVDLYNRQIMGSGKDDSSEGGSKEAMFANGSTVMFSEGPWQSAGVYDLLWNNNQLKTAGTLGVTSEDANDPVYREPFAVCRVEGWWADSTAPAELANKYYGNGHVITISDRVTSLAKAAAALEFARWYTQEVNDNGDYYLSTWCKAGHIPAWKNVYESASFKAVAESNKIVKALGNPEDIIALESTEYATLLIDGIKTAVTNVQAQLQSSSGCTVEQAKSTITAVANSTQDALELLNLGF